MAAIVTYGAWTRRETRGTWRPVAPLDLLTDEDGATLTDEDGAVLEGDGAGYIAASGATWRGGTFGTWSAV